MENIILSFIIGLSFCLFVYLKGLNPISLFYAWLGLFLWSSLLRFMVIVGSKFVLWSGRITLISIFIFLIYLTLKRIKAIRISSWKINSMGAYINIYLIVVSVLLLSWHLLPVFDIDTLSYHLTGPDWFLARNTLVPDVFREFHSTDFRRYWIGPEDYFLFIFNGTNIGLGTSLILGWLKVFCLLTIVSIVKKLGALPVLLTVFLITIDEYFVFSGVNSYVNLSSGFLAIATFSSWAVYRSVRGGPYTIALSVSSLLLLTSIKQHGLYLFVLGIAFLILVLLIRGFKKISWNKLNFKFFMPIFLASIPVLAVFGINLYETGTPFYPFDLLFFKSKIFIESYVKEQFVNKQGLISLILERKYKILTYPGNLALKGLVLICIPAIFTYSLLLMKRKLRKQNLQDYFAVRKTVFFSLICIVWGLIITNLNPDEAKFEGRYIRFIYPVAVLGIIYYFVSFRKLIQKKINFQNRTLLLSLMVLSVVYLSYRWNFSYTNINKLNRPQWKNVIMYINEVGWNDNYANANVLDFMSPYAGKILNSKALQALPEKIRKTGNRTLVYSTNNWPSFFSLPHAIRIDSFCGTGGWKKNDLLSEHSGIHYIVVTNDLLDLATKQIPELQKMKRNGDDAVTVFYLKNKEFGAQ